MPRPVDSNEFQAILKILISLYMYVIAKLIFLTPLFWERQTLCGGWMMGNRWAIAVVDG